MTKPAQLAKSQHPDTKLTPAERTAKLLAFRGPTYNFGAAVPSKPVHVAKGWVRTV